MIWANIIHGSPALLLGGAALATLWQLKWVQPLPKFPVTGKPGCSVVIAARDEEARIEQTLRRLLSQTHVDIELIVVDDRSRDRTSEILRRIASEDPRIRPLRIDALPDGWLGKCHACHLGAKNATREWILFTDADCWLKPDTLAGAISVGERERVDHITLCPGVVAESPWTRAWHLMFIITLVGWIAGVNRDRGKFYLGIGAFNLVRASVYRDFGGYEALRLTVLDDVKFGLLVRRAGKRTRAFLGMDDVECHWGTTIANMIKVMEKNYFAAIDFRFGIVVVCILFSLGVTTILISGLLSGTVIGLIAALSPLLGFFPATILARRLGWSAFTALRAPFMVPVFMYALLNSTFVTLRQGGVRWRDTFYSLKTLRAGGVR